MHIESDRLVIQKISTEDAPFFFKLFNSEGWIKNIGNKNIKDLEAVKKHIEDKYLVQYNKYPFGACTVRLKDGTTIGTCGIYVRPYLDIPDVGFAFLEEYTGNGYAYESSKALMDFVKSTYGIRQFSGITVPENKASIRLLEKLGLKAIKEITAPNDQTPLIYFESPL